MAWPPLRVVPWREATTKHCRASRLSSLGSACESTTPRWNVELSTRLVARQNRAPGSLAEQATPAFALVDLRSYWQATNHLQLVARVENLTDAFYREHLDFRTGRGVYQPGINFYFGSELTY